MISHNFNCELSGKDHVFGQIDVSFLYPTSNLYAKNVSLRVSKHPDFRFLSYLSYGIDGQSMCHGMRRKPRMSDLDRVDILPNVITQSVNYNVTDGVIYTLVQETFEAT